METKKLRPMSKAEELAHLHELYESDSYFRAAITLHDYNRICDNIENDYPVFMGTSIGRAIHYVETTEFAKRDFNAKIIRCQCQIQEQEGKRVMIVEVNDPHNEGNAIVTVRENQVGTDFIASVKFEYMIDGLADKSDGFTRIGKLLARASFVTDVYNHFYNKNIGEHFSILI